MARRAILSVSAFALSACGVACAARSPAPMPVTTWAAADERLISPEHPTVSCPAFAAAHGTTLQGIVRDKWRGRVVANATIAVTDFRRGARTTSDSSGTFLVHDVPRSDTLYVVATADGYREWSGKIAVTQASPLIVLDLIPEKPSRVDGPFIVSPPEPGDVGVDFLLLSCQPDPAP